MEPRLQIALVVGLGGVKVERPAVMLVGFVPGALLGATLAPRVVTGIEEPTSLAVTALAGVVGGLIGAQLAWGAWVLVHALPGFVAGVLVAAPALGVSPARAEPSPEVALVFGAGVVGAMLAWAVHRVFVAVFTAVVGSAMVSAAVFGENVYVPAGRALLRHPESQVRLVADSLSSLGAPTLVLAAVFALVQLGQLYENVAAE